MRCIILTLGELGLKLVHQCSMWLFVIFVNCHCKFPLYFCVYCLSKFRKSRLPLRPSKLSMCRTMVISSKLCMLCIILPVGKMFKRFSLLPGISSHNHCAIVKQAQSRR